MSLAAIVILALKFSIVAVVFSLGLTARPGDVLYVLREPRTLARSLLSMSVAMPLLSIALVLMMHLPRPAAIVLVALSLAPVPPILPRRQQRAGGDASYAVGLLVAAAVVSVVWIPVALEIIERVFGVPLGMPPAKVAMLVATTVLAPLIAGVVVHRLAPSLAAKVAPGLAMIGTLVLVAGAVAIIASQWRSMGALVHDGTVLAFSVFVVAGLIVGHLLGGPDPDNRTVLALATAARNPAIALAIARLNFPDEKAVIPALLLYLLTMLFVSFPYVTWRRRRAAAAASATPHPAL
jgi:bile acid:Na+ symporter, BASS family